MIDSLGAKKVLVESEEEFEKMLETNTRSAGQLLAFLDSIQPQAKGYPKTAAYALNFFVVDGEAIREVQLKFRTTGGDCKKQVREDFSQFFRECGVAQSFRWSIGSWGALHIHGGESEEELREKARLIKRSHSQHHTNDDSVEREEDTVQEGDREGADVSIREAPSAPESSGRDGSGGLVEGKEAPTLGSAAETDETEEKSTSEGADRYGEHGSIFSMKAEQAGETETGMMSIEELIQSLDPALKLIAEHAWGGQDEGTVAGVLEMLDSFKRSSPRLGEAISEKVWKGRLSLQDVCEGLDQRDVAIATSLVYHVHRSVERKGRPESWPPPENI
ncbi:hypothetical protein KFL_000740290 [Klebsormidium nitens]|uniref:Uncharacterized protein n=1 Tax=Klebsormidium nitens TaxID=105231 RepID=A0A1Y1HZE0_KLENI|nr:hypothetical protein KFL_000740290 [Klebsormidium nitens]|eukprot:GAQ81228.1 hypothetical protein KFL_000740290 [Klebsormidium nitens]